MATPTPSLYITEIDPGTQSGTWGTTTNNNWTYMDHAVAGALSITISGTGGHTLSTGEGDTESRYAALLITGTATGTNTITAPLKSKIYLVSNGTVYPVVMSAGSGSTVTVPANTNTLVYCDGSNGFYSGITGFTGSLNITGTITASGSINGATFGTSGAVPQFAGGVTGQIPYQTGSNTTAYTPTPTTGSYLSWNGSAYTWSTGSVTTASNLAGGSANSVPYQTSAGNTAFLTPTGGTPLTLQYNGSTLNWAAAGAVSSFSASGTGLTPSTPTTGSITLGGTLNVANGGTGATSFTAAGLAQLSGATFSGNITAPQVTVTSNFNSQNVNSTGNTVTLAIGGVATLEVNNVYNNFAPNTSNVYSCGAGSQLWTVIYAASSTINTSDANEKQQIAPLTNAEMAVARTLKGLIRTYKFNDAVQKKGKDARIHTGVIAQDVQAAFAAQGLNANEYGVFCSDTWYEVDGKIKDENNIKFTADSPGAIEVTRLGVRYDELFAFIIGAL
jgi:hypothetical protein